MPHITNMKYADLGTAVAAGTIVQGQICIVTDTTTGRRKMTVAADTDDALVLAGNYAVAMKFTTDAAEVNSSTASASTGSRLPTIATDDVILEVRRGAKIEYAAAELGASLDPGRAGATPVVGQALGVSGGYWATIAAATSAGIATPVIGRVNEVFGTTVRIELL